MGFAALNPSYGALGDGVRKIGVTFRDVIADVSCQLSDNGVRISEVPAEFNHAWWPNSPSVLEKFPDQLKSDYGISSGPTQLNEEFDAEVKAIHECLDKLGHVPRFANWQNTKDQNARLMYKALNQRADALYIWDHIAFPLRRRGDILFEFRHPAKSLVEGPLLMRCSWMTSLGASRRTQSGTSR